MDAMALGGPGVGLVLALLAATPLHRAPPVLDWGNVARARPPAFVALVTEARRLLVTMGVEGDPLTAAVRAEALLVDALRLVPAGDVEALVLLADARAAAGRPAGAVPALERALALLAADTPARAGGDAREATVAIELGDRERALGHADAALKAFTRAQRTGAAGAAAALGAGGVLLGMDRARDAESRFRAAIAEADAADETKTTPAVFSEARALARHGLALALALEGDDAAAREAAPAAAAQAWLLDPRALDDDASLFDGEIQQARVLSLPGARALVRGLLGIAFGRAAEARVAFQRASAEARDTPLARAAREWLDRANHAEPARGWRMVALATVRSQGGVAAPLIDAALKARAAMFTPCLARPPSATASSLRLSLLLRLDVRGSPTDVTIAGAAQDGGDNGGLGACLAQAIKDGLVVVPSSSTPMVTRARIEIVLAPHNTNPY